MRFEDPNRYSEGFPYGAVNVVLVVDNGKLAARRPAALFEGPAIEHVEAWRPSPAPCAEETHSGFGPESLDLDSELFALGRLAAHKKGLGVFPFATDLERSKVLVPRAFRGLGLRFTPKLQLIQVLNSDFALAESLKQVIAESRGGY